jgi:hypothetical protein
MDANANARFDVNKLLPMPIHAGTTGSVTGWEGEFTRGGQGEGRYEYKQMQWENSTHGSGRGYQVTFGYNDRALTNVPSIMPNVEPTMSQDLVLSSERRRPRSHHHKVRTHRHKVRK